jgi:hypothetical protein
MGTKSIDRYVIAVGGQNIVAGTHCWRSFAVELGEDPCTSRRRHGGYEPASAVTDFFGLRAAQFPPGIATQI